MKGFSDMNNEELSQMRHDTLIEIVNTLSKFFFVNDSEMLLMSHGGLTSCIGSKRGYKALSSFLQRCLAAKDSEANEEMNLLASALSDLSYEDRKSLIEVLNKLNNTQDGMAVQEMLRIFKNNSKN